LPSQVNIVVQINGKTRTVISIDSSKSREELEKLIRENEKVKKWLDNKKIIKTITIENKLVNFVISNEIMKNTESLPKQKKKE